MRLAILIAAFAVLTASSAVAECLPPKVEIVQSDPLRATLRWTPAEGAAGYFLQYSTGKFPTQISFTARPGEPITADLVNLTPGIATTVQFCEALDGGRCPAPDSATVCNSLVEVAAPWSYADVEQPDPYEAVCTIHGGQGLSGQSVGHPYEEPVSTGSAEACCHMCAWVGSNLPYQARCTHFVFDDSSGQCRYLREAGDASDQPGMTAGEVRAWPRIKE